MDAAPQEKTTNVPPLACSRTGWVRRVERLGRIVPALAWLPHYRPADLRADTMAGVTTAVMLVPQAMAYAMLAGLPPIVGLYAALVPPAVYAVFGTSRQLSVGPVAMDSLLTASALAALSLVDTPSYVAAAVLLAALVGAVQLVLGLARAGFVVNFLSRPVISGFTSAAALIIATSQLSHIFGLSLPRGPVHEVWWAALSALPSWHLPTLAIALVAFVLLRGLRRRWPRFPAALAAVVATTVAYLVLDLEGAGVRVVGEVPAGLPVVAPPRFDTAWMRELVPAALTIALVSFMESISVGTHFARSNGQDVDANKELIALGAANLGGSLVGGYPVAGGFSRTAVNARAGARTGLASLTTAVTVGLTLVAFTPAFHDLPKATLAAIIGAAVVSLIDWRTPRRLWRVDRHDFWLLAITFAATLWLGISQGIVTGIGLSVLSFVVRSTRPHYAVLGRVKDTEAYLNVRRHADVQTFPEVLVVRIDAQLYFGNVSFLRQTLHALEADRQGKLRAVVFDASGINQLDSSALDALEDFDAEAGQRGIRVVYSAVKGPVRDMMERGGLLQRLRRDDRIFTRTHDAVECARRWADASSTACMVECRDLSRGVDPGVGKTQ